MSNPKIQQTKVTLNQVEEKISHVPVVNFIYLFLKRNMGNVNYDTSSEDTLKLVPEDYKSMANSIDETVS